MQAARLDAPRTAFGEHLEPKLVKGSRVARKELIAKLLQLLLRLAEVALAVLVLSDHILLGLWVPFDPRRLRTNAAARVARVEKALHVIGDIRSRAAAAEDHLDGRLDQLEKVVEVRVRVRLEPDNRQLRHRLSDLLRSPLRPVLHPDDHDARP